MHFAFFAPHRRRGPAADPGGPPPRVEERRDGLRDVLARTRERLDGYTLELQRHGLEASSARSAG